MWPRPPSLLLLARGWPRVTLTRLKMAAWVAVRAAAVVAAVAALLQFITSIPHQQLLSAFAGVASGDGGECGNGAAAAEAEGQAADAAAVLTHA